MLLCLQKLEGSDSIGSLSDPELILSELVNRRADHEDEEISHCFPDKQEELSDMMEIKKNGASSRSSPKHETTAKNTETESKSTSIGEIHSQNNNYQTALHDAVHKGLHEMVKIPPEGGVDIHKLDSQRWTPKALAERQGNKSIYELLVQYEDKTTREHEINFIGPETVTRRRRINQVSVDRHRDKHFKSLGKKDLKISESSYQRFSPDCQPNRKRVTIHMDVPNGGSPDRPPPKLIMLPDSIEELLKVAGKIYCLNTR